MTIMEDDKVFLFVPPDAFGLDQEGATLGQEGNKIQAIHGARADDCWPSGGRAAAALLTLLMPVAPPLRILALQLETRQDLQRYVLMSAARAS